MDCSNIINSFVGRTHKFIWGTKGFKKIDIIYSTYKIPSGEKIIAYLKSSIILFPLMMDGLIFTNKAVYTHPCHEDWAPNNRHPFSELSRFHIIFSGEKSDVRLENVTSSYVLLNNTFLGKNRGGQELVRILTAIQEHCINHYSRAREQYLELCVDIIQDGRKTLANAEHLPENLKRLLKYCKQNPQFADSAVTLLAEDLLIGCDYLGFENYVLEETDCISEKCRQDLANIKMLHADQIFENLHSPDYSISEETLENLKKYIDKEQKKANMPQKYVWVKAYILARKADRNEFFEYCQQNKLGQYLCEYEKLISLECMIRNRHIAKIWNSIKEGNPISYQDSVFCDCLGFNVMHYCILGRMYKIFRDFPKNEDINIRWEQKNLFNYKIIVAKYCPEYLIEILETFDPDINKLCQKIKHRQQLLKIRQTNLQFGEKVVYNMQCTANSGVYTTIDQRRDWAVYQKRVQEFRESVSEDKQQLERLQQQLEQLISYKQEEVKMLLQKIFSDCSHPLLMLILQLDDPMTIIEQILFSCPDDSIIYCYNGNWFALSKAIHINISPAFVYDSDPCSESFFEHVYKKDYIDSWFSPQAHQDVKVLKSEFRTLAKQYHPDINHASISKVLFQEIIKERDKIERNIME